MSIEGTTVQGRRIGPIGICVITAYLIILSTLLMYGLIQLWPSPAASSVSTPSVIFLRWTFSISGEVRLLLIVALAGALGGLVHALRSLYWYVGNWSLVWSWLPMYILLPFVGAALGVVFYFVIRGGFFSPQATVSETSPYGFAALAGLVGMFAEQAVEKLKTVAETVLTRAPQGEGHVQPKNGEDTSGGSRGAREAVD